VVKFYSLGGLLFLLWHTPTFSQSAERLSLKEATRIALQYNPEIQGAQRGVEAAKGRFWRGIAPPPATLSVSYDYIPTGSPVKDHAERMIGVSQTFEFPTTIALRGSSLSCEAEAAEADVRSTSLSIIVQVKLAYYSVLARELKLRLAQEILGIAADFARKAEIRHGTGEGTSLEQLTARVQQTQAHNAVEVARNELRKSTTGLNFALGRGREQAGTELTLTDSLRHPSYAFSLDSLIELAHRSNPELQSASSRLGAASVNRTIAWSSFLPSFTVSYSRQLQAGNPNLYGVALGISLPIWFLLDQKGQVQEATATYARLASDLTSRQNLVILDVTNAYVEMKNDEHQVDLYSTDLLPQAEEVHRAAAISYTAGEITYVEYLQARQTLTSVRSTHIDALCDYNTAIVRLEQAVGRTFSE
jgi:outer membrane protein TolC